MACAWGCLLVPYSARLARCLGLLHKHASLNCKGATQRDGLRAQLVGVPSIIFFGQNDPRPAATLAPLQIGEACSRRLLSFITASAECSAGARNAAVATFFKLALTSDNGSGGDVNKETQPTRVKQDGPQGPQDPRAAAAEKTHE